MLNAAGRGARDVRVPSPSSMCVLLGQNNLPANAKALPCDQFAARQGVLLDKAGKNGLDR